MPNENIITAPPPSNKTPSPIDKAPPKEVLDRTFSLDNAPKFSEENNSRITTVDERSGKEKELKQSEAPIKQPVQEQKTEQKPEQKVEESKREEKKISSVIKPPGEVKREEKVVTQPKQVSQKITPKNPNERDYTGYSAEETTALKQMSNEGFDFATKLIKQNRELNSKKDGAWYVHPEAYRLSPAFQQGQQKLSTVAIEANTWRDLLIACQKGEKVKNFVGIDQAGKPVFNGEVEPTKEIEELLRVNYTTCVTTYQNQERELIGLKDQYSQQLQTDLQMIEQERNKRFGWVSDKEMLKWTVPVDTGDGQIVDKPIGDVRNDFINIFPPYLRDNPGTNVAADLMVALIVLQGELREALNGKQNAEFSKEEVLRGEPSSQTKPKPETETNEKLGPVREFNLDPTLTLR